MPQTQTRAEGTEKWSTSCKFHVRHATKKRDRNKWQMTQHVQSDITHTLLTNAIGRRHKKMCRRRIQSKASFYTRKGLRRWQAGPSHQPPRLCVQWGAQGTHACVHYRGIMTTGWATMFLLARNDNQRGKYTVRRPVKPNNRFERTGR